MKWGTAVISMALITAIVVRPTSVDVINAMNGAFVGTVKAMLGAHEAIAEKDVELAWEYIYKLSDDDQLDLLAELTDEDFAWLTEVSRDV